MNEGSLPFLFHCGKGLLYLLVCFLLPNSVSDALPFPCTLRFLPGKHSAPMQLISGGKESGSSSTFSSSDKDRLLRCLSLLNFCSPDRFETGADFCGLTRQPHWECQAKLICLNTTQSNSMYNDRPTLRKLYASDWLSQSK